MSMSVLNSASAMSVTIISWRLGEGRNMEVESWKLEGAEISTKCFIALDMFGLRRKKVEKIAYSTKNYSHTESGKGKN